jgi:hypothetical protein
VSQQQSQPQSQPSNERSKRERSAASLGRCEDADRYANVVQVTGTREEIAILLGTHQIWHKDKDMKEVVVPLEERILLNPGAAKRLMLQLGILLQGYETRYGTIPSRGLPRPDALPTK